MYNEKNLYVHEQGSIYWYVGESGTGVTQNRSGGILFTIGICWVIRIYIPCINKKHVESQLFFFLNFIWLKFLFHERINSNTDNKIDYNTIRLFIQNLFYRQNIAQNKIWYKYVKTLSLEQGLHENMPKKNLAVQ